MYKGEALLMKTDMLVDAAPNAAAKLRPAAQAATPASAALAPLISLLPKILPFVVRSVRRYPTQAAIAGVGLLLFAAVQRRHSTRRRYSPYFD